MENCVFPGLDKFQSIIRNCIVFGQSRDITVKFRDAYTEAAKT